LPIKSRLPELRVARDRMTLQELSSATGIAMSTLSKLDRSLTTRIDFDVLESLCRLFGVGAGELLEIVAADEMPSPRRHKPKEPPQPEG
jgi:putative transcriptional regulator